MPLQSVDDSPRRRFAQQLALGLAASAAACLTQL
jgi:hypothetical protein